MEALGLLDPCVASTYPPLFSMHVPVKHAMATVHQAVANYLTHCRRPLIRVRVQILNSVSIRVHSSSSHTLSLTSSDTSDFVCW